MRLHEWMKYRDQQALPAEEQPSPEAAEPSAAEPAPPAEQPSAPPVAVRTADEAPGSAEPEEAPLPSAPAVAPPVGRRAAATPPTADEWDEGVVGVEGLEALELATSDDGPEGRLNEARQRIARHRAALRAQQAQQALPLDLGPAFVPPVREPGPKETREQLLERLLDPLLTLRDTAVLLGVCPTTVRRYTNRGMLAHLRTGGNQRRFRLSQVLEFMERQDQPTR